ncbi:MAG TPA: cyclic nucleotide-binding domain-containing protein [Anaeromyxobacter sp.]|nr:cyclic nucleotide-binding domain-containing protein [Anaeromyxobacter sp.]
MSLDKVAALRRSPLFELLSPAELEVLSELSRPRPLEPGEAVFHAGELGASLFVLVEGEVEVVADGRGPSGQVLSVLSAPESFGEMALVDREMRSATVRARGRALALELTAENFAAFRKRSRDGFTFVVINIARVLSGRLRETSRKLVERS